MSELVENNVGSDTNALALESANDNKAEFLTEVGKGNFDAVKQWMETVATSIGLQKNPVERNNHLSWLLHAKVI